jgi:plastocyanin
MDHSYTSAGLDQSEAFSHTFTARGRYQYFCALHPHMTATVVVK